MTWVSGYVTCDKNSGNNGHSYFGCGSTGYMILATINGGKMLFPDFSITTGPHAAKKVSDNPKG